VAVPAAFQRANEPVQALLRPKLLGGHKAHFFPQGHLLPALLGLLPAQFDLLLAQLNLLLAQLKLRSFHPEKVLFMLLIVLNDHLHPYQDEFADGRNFAVMLRDAGC
jgi:hypothetical protein